MAVAGVPDPHDEVRHCRNKGAAVRAPGETQNRAQRTLETMHGQAGVDGVEHNTGLVAPTGEVASVRAEGEGVDSEAQIGDAAARLDPDRPPRLAGVPVPELDATVPLEAGEGLPVGTERYVQKTVFLDLEREPVLVNELPEIAPLPAAEVRFARSRLEQTEERACLAGVVGSPGRKREVRAGGVHRGVERLLDTAQAGVGLVGLPAGRG